MFFFKACHEIYQGFYALSGHGVVQRGAHAAYQTVAFQVGESRRCRFFVAISGSEMSTPGDLPASITLDYRDLFTGETQRSVWRRDPGTTASGWRRASQKASPNALLAGAWGDLDLITRNLVDQLFP